MTDCLTTFAQPLELPSSPPEPVEEPISCCGTVLLSADRTQCLLVQQRDTRKWSLPKGSLTPGEHFFDCMTREMQEETSIELRRCRYVIEHPGEKFKKYFIQTLRLLQPHHHLPLRPQDTLEILCARWVPVRVAARQYRLNCVTRHFLTRYLEDA